MVDDIPSGGAFDSEEILISESDMELITFLVDGGYGWAKFANNVLDQGWVSKKQRETMTNMAGKLAAQRKIIQNKLSVRNRSTAIAGRNAVGINAYFPSILGGTPSSNPMFKNEECYDHSSGYHFDRED